MIPLVFFGTGGHSKVLIDIAEKAEGFKILGLFDDNSHAPATVLDYPVLGGRRELEEMLRENPDLRVIVAIGNNMVRSEVANWLRTCGAIIPVLIHPSAQIGRNVEVSSGSVIMAGVVVNSATKIGCDVILNTRCSVDHDCVVGDASHVGPGVSLCGGVSIGQGALLGVGSQVIPGIKVADRVIVAAGATVVSDVESDSMVGGTPAKKIK
ncbi:MAG: acetyltransferase [Bdellovibrio sp.]|nr:acetyltransferase [Bdellovibrio sp.]